MTEICCICLENLEESHALSCSHIFHPLCIIRWFTFDDQSKCPVCKRDIVSEDINRLCLPDVVSTIVQEMRSRLDIEGSRAIVLIQSLQDEYSARMYAMSGTIPKVHNKPFVPKLAEPQDLNADTLRKLKTNHVLAMKGLLQQQQIAQDALLELNR